MKKLAALICLWLVAGTVMAQDEPEYRLELGGGVGLMAYEGDFNSNPLKGLRPTGTLIVKFKSNPRVAWNVNLGYGSLAGSSSKVSTHYPGLAEHKADFKTSLVDLGVRFEYNFWAFGTGREYFGAKRLTPFIGIGLGVAYGNCKLTQDGATTTKGTLVGQLPIGIGLKYKVATRLNLAAELMMHFTGGDKLDGVDDPYGIESSGLFKNTDCYSTLYVTLTYDLWAKCRTCHKE
ncbi:MAG: outer membrane beta-barrel protein [Prevotella sp.]|nr:outer membrane beta-barrel protein [Prevotella sp.]